MSTCKPNNNLLLLSGDWDGFSYNLYFARLRCTNKSSQYYWSISEENSPPIICYRTTHTIQDRAWQMERWVEHYSELYAIQKEYGVWRSPERYRVLTSNGGARLRTFGAERGSGFACTWKSTQEGHYPIWDPEMLKWRCLYRALFATSFCKDFWGRYWGRAIQLLVNLFAPSPLTVPDVFARVNSPQFSSCF